MHFYCTYEHAHKFAKDNKAGVSLSDIMIMSDHSIYDTDEIEYKNGEHN